MAATAVKFAGFKDHSPAQLREILPPEDHGRFDANFRETLDEMARTLSLEPLEGFLEYWRRYTWSQHTMGPERWRAMLDKAERIMAGERFPTVSMEEMDRRIAERLASDR